MKKVFTTGQVAKICKVAPRTVSKWFDSGRLRGYRIPGSQDRRIPREHLIKFLKEHGMPLGELEEEGLHKVLIIGADKLLKTVTATVPAALEPASGGFKGVPGKFLEWDAPRKYAVATTPSKSPASRIKMFLVIN